MQIKYPRQLTLKNFKRFENRALKMGRPFVCCRCNKPFKMGDFIFKFRAKHNYYCIECYQELYRDIPDSILDKEDEQFIEIGFYPSTITTYATINAYSV